MAHRVEQHLEEIHLQMIDAGKIDMHGDRVAEISYHLARKTGVSECLAHQIKRAARYHDIGKLVIPHDILVTTGRLTPEQFEIIKTHSMAGYQISNDLLKDIHPISYNVWDIATSINETEYKQECMDTLFAYLVRIVCLHHHEFWDGSGYPYGIDGESIPVPARIVAVADIFDAVSSRRIYKDAYPMDHVHEIMVQALGKKLDPHYGQIFLDNFDEFVEIHKTLPK